jgi:hypothetical protein
MFDHHQRAVDKLTDHLKDDPAFLALIIAGSVAKGRAQPDSDLDAMMVVSDDEFAKWMEHGNLCFQPEGICDYPGGFVDGKIINEQFIRDVDEKGSEVARSAFIGTFVAFSRIEGLDKLVKRIPQYPVHEKTEKLESFFGHFEAARWFMGEAERRGNDTYLLTRNAAQMVLFGGRMILAHNEMLFCYHKYLMDDLAKAPLKPEGLVELAKKLMTCPSKAAADEFYDCIMSFTDWPMPGDGWGARFMKETEWNWRAGVTPIEDR